MRSRVNVALAPVAFEAISTLAHFWRQVEITNTCWYWRGSKTSAGYGRFFVKRHSIYAHRFAYFIHFGELDPALEVLHECDNPPCVRPGHLRQGTHEMNMADAHERGLIPTGHLNGAVVKRAWTHCVHGHPFDEANTYWYTWNGITMRCCRACRIIRVQRHRDKQRAQ